MVAADKTASQDDQPYEPSQQPGSGTLQRVVPKPGDETGLDTERSEVVRENCRGTAQCQPKIVGRQHACNRRIETLFQVSLIHECNNTAKMTR
jgi:hypothetical protein